ncbi:MAG: hypothetical protein IPI81_17835 [Flavobacteriales bacterium]|nr:hypothetical protein [Flavobacteriales bacterium]
MTTRPPPGCSSVNLYCQDESRFGLFTRAGKGITAKGVKPVCAFQQVFQYTYVFGAYSPISGDNFQLNYPVVLATPSGIFLDHLQRIDLKSSRS